MDDVCSAIFGLKRGKSDASGRLSSDHFIFACKELAVYLSFLFSALLVHGHVPVSYTHLTLPTILRV